MKRSAEIEPRMIQEDETMAKEKAPMPMAAPADDKKRAIDTAMAQIEKMYGKT
jgi:hypothetical protein